MNSKFLSIIFLIAIFLSFGTKSSLANENNKQIEQKLTQFYVEEKYGYINKEGKTIIKPQFEDAKNFANNGFAAVQVGEQWGYINYSGKFVIEPQFMFVKDFADNVLAKVEIDKKWGFINEKREIIIEPQFNYTKPFTSSGLASVHINM